MNIHDALNALTKAPAGSFASRPGGAKVRLSRGPEEHALHRYVVDLADELREYEGDSGVRAFEAAEEDIWDTPPTFEPGQEAQRGKLRDDWTCTKRAIPTMAARGKAPADVPTAKETPNARR